MAEQGVRINAGPPRRLEPPDTSPEMAVDTSDEEGRVTESPRGYPLDEFHRTVIQPTVVTGSLITAGLGTRYQARGGQGVVKATGDLLDSTFSYATDIIYRVGSYVGQWYYAWVGQPSWTTCTGFDNAFPGWWEFETWQKVQVPAHPANMYGMTVDASATASANEIGAAYGLEVVVLSHEPTELRQGTVVGSVPADGVTRTYTIPGSDVPDEGEFIWIGLRPGWQCNYGDWACGWTWPYSAKQGQFSVAGVDYLGYSGKVGTFALADLTWETYTGDIEYIGETEGSDHWGTFEWESGGETGGPSWGIDDEGIWVESTAAAEKMWYLPGPDDEYEPDETQDDLSTDTEAEESVDDETTVDAEDEQFQYGPWSDQKGVRVDVYFTIDAAGLTGQTGVRQLEVAIVGDGVRTAAKANLGDGFDDAGVGADGGNGWTSVEKAIAADTQYVLALDTRAEVARAKLWANTGRLSEATQWDVDIEIAESTADGDRLELWFRVGNVASSQRMTVNKIVAYEAGESGDEVAYELVGTSDGTDNRFPTGHRFTPGSVVAAVAGIGASAVSEYGDEFSLDIRPTSGSIIRTRYVIAGDDDDDEDFVAE